MRIPAKIAALSSIVFLFCFFAVFAAVKHPSLKDTSEETCVRCHKDIKAGKFLHSLFEVASCDTCHSLGLEGDTTVMKLSEEGNAVCLKCHSAVEKSLASPANVHGIINTGNCIACHDPHSSEHEKLLFDKGNNLCAKCHTDQSGEKKFPHAALEMMECDECHNPHSSLQKFLLTSPAVELCQGCHDSSDSDFRKKHGGQPVSFSGCANCHEPHGSSQEKILKGLYLHGPFVGGCDSCHDEPEGNKAGLSSEVPALCYMCHSDIDEVIGKSDNVHGAVESGCSSCHDPHMSDNKSLLLADEVSTCGDCHDTDDDAFRKIHKSQPVKQNGCSSCHDPHASSSRKLLKGKSLHSPFAEADCYGCHISAKGEKALTKKKGDALCVSCHNEIMSGEVKHDAIDMVNCAGCHGYHQSDNVSLLLETPTATCTACHDLTDDLKKSHGSVEMGKAVCTSCHDAHSSNNDNLMKDGFIHAPFGDGNCSACHDIPMNEMNTACLMCHDSIEKNLSSAFPHAAVEMSGCQSCHEPHISPVEKQLRGSNAEVCGECHDLKDKAYLEKHGGQPMNLVNCASCHNPHGSSEEHIFKGSSYHMPFKENMCDGCHVPSDKEIGLTEKGNALCFGCHSDQEGELKKKNLHPAFGSGNCVDCHDPHLDDAVKLLPSKGKDFCFTCHTGIKKSVGSKFPHAAMEMMDCTECHHPHASENETVLILPYPDVCTVCHDSSDKDLRKKHFDVDMDSLKCGKCHNPHGSENAKLLNGFTHSPFADGMCDACHTGADNGKIKTEKNGSDELCYMCHDSKKSEIAGYAVKHAALDMDSCTVCHDPHASATANLLTGDNVTTCTECHADIGDLMKEKAITHGIITSHGCSACHKPHGSGNVSILKNTVNDTCLECHLKENGENAGEEPQVTLFSDMNLDYEYYESIPKLLLSVNRSTGHPTRGHPVYKEENKFEKGREFNCVSCHEPHAWDKPGGLKGNQGSRVDICAGCHSEK